MVCKAIHGESVSMCESEDLDLGSSKRRFKSYKGMVLKKLKTKQKHKMRFFTEKVGTKKKTKVTTLRHCLNCTERDYDYFVQEESRLTRLGKGLDDAIG